MLDALDQYSLETQRPVTLPLLRDLLTQHHEQGDAQGTQEAHEHDSPPSQAPLED